MGAHGDGGAGKDLQTQIKDVRGFEGAGWTFVEAAARRLLGGLRGASERVQANARLPRTAWRRLRSLSLASGRKALGRTVCAISKRACRALWCDLRTQFVVSLLSVAVRSQKEQRFALLAPRAAAP